MSVDIGITGLPKSGRTTIFNALTKGRADTGSYRREALAPHIGVAKVPEPRLGILASMLQPKKVTPAEVRYIDVGASVKELAKDKGIGGELLNQVGSAHSLINVARAFTDECVPHIEGSLDVARDIETMNLELAFSDLVLLERRLEKIALSLKGAKAVERHTLLHEQEILTKIKASLEKDIPLRELKLTPEESKAMSHFQFLTAKPLLIVVNIGEEQLTSAPSLEAEMKECYQRPRCDLITLCGKLEMELSQLEEAEARELRSGFGLEESGLDRTIKLSYGLLGFVSFFTIVSNEIRAWSIKSGTAALKAAGKIHSDMERGFIRAEVVSYDDLIKSHSLAEARKKGLLRLEGKNYPVQDGDVITFLFNV